MTLFKTSVEVDERKGKVRKKFTVDIQKIKLKFNNRVDRNVQKLRGKSDIEVMLHRENSNNFRVSTEHERIIVHISEIFYLLKIIE